ncbi:MAG: 3-deoxy-manno-octulosonate cytidylyltransferase [Anaerolineales bacterium]|nr:3-deoxy-manno-octulosonate cytidylyltransferase [Anaerolineales bacterium]
MRVFGVIPARLAASRLPNKVLAEIAGQPMIQHVWQQAAKARSLDGLCVATDSAEIRAVVEGWGGVALMTSPYCRSGTERIASIVKHLKADLIINIQGDEPLIEPALLDAVVSAARDTGADLITPVYAISEMDDLFSPDIVKVVRGSDGRALYFSRSAVPFYRGLDPRDWLNRWVYWGHIGVYAYRMEVIEGYLAIPPSPIETAEHLEQLRFLDHGYTIQTIESDYQPVAVDTPGDLDRVRKLFAVEK